MKTFRNYQLQACQAVLMAWKDAGGDLIITATAGPNAGKSCNLTYGKWA